MKKFQKILYLFFAPVLTFVIVNQFDEDLNPELQAILSITDPVIPDDQNAFYAYVGFYAPEGEDIVVAGKRILDAYQKTSSSDKSLDFDEKDVLGENAMELEDEDIQICDEFEDRTYCLSNIRNSSDRLEILSKKYRTLIDRYYALYKYQNFQSHSSYIPTTPFSVHKYVLGDISSIWISGAHGNAINLLIDDIIFHRMIGRETRLLIHKMIAIAALNQSYHLLHDFINECPDCVLKNARIETVLASLEEEFLLSRRVMEGEIKWAYSTTMEIFNSSSSKYEYYKQAMRWEAAGESGSVWHGLLGYITLINATINEGFRTVQQPNLKLASLKFKEFENELIRIKSEIDQYRYRWWDYFYNPGGKYLSSLYDMDPIYSRYFEIPFQLEAKIRLIRLQALIKKNNVAESDTTDFLDNQPEQNQDPYLDKPVKYDASGKFLYVIPFAREDEKLIVFL